MVSKITDYTEVTQLADDDVFYVVDVSDTTQSTEGTSKFVKKKNIYDPPQYTPPQASEWSTLNFDSNVGEGLVDHPNGLEIFLNGSSNSGLRALTRPALTPPYKVRVHILPDFDEDDENMGLGFRDSSTGKFVYIHRIEDFYLRVYQMDSLTNWNNTVYDQSNVTSRGSLIIKHLEIEDDGTDIRFKYSATEGVTYEEVHRESRMNFLDNPPDQIAIFAGDHAASGMSTSKVVPAYWESTGIDRYAGWVHPLDNSIEWRYPPK